MRPAWPSDPAWWGECSTVSVNRSNRKAALEAQAYYRLYRPAGSPLDREHITEPVVTGIRAIDALTLCGKGQRMGIFGGSGVGKSTLLGSMARHNSADVTVIALIGERNREVRAFLEQDMGPEGAARSVVVCATSISQRRCACAPASWLSPSPSTSAIRELMCC